MLGLMAFGCSALVCNSISSKVTYSCRMLDASILHGLIHILNKAKNWNVSNIHVKCLHIGQAFYLNWLYFNNNFLKFFEMSPIHVECLHIYSVQAFYMSWWHFKNKDFGNFWASILHRLVTFHNVFEKSPIHVECLHTIYVQAFYMDWWLFKWSKILSTFFYMDWRLFRMSPKHVECLHIAFYMDWLYLDIDSIIRVNPLILKCNQSM